MERHLSTAGSGRPRCHSLEGGWRGGWHHCFVNGRASHENITIYTYVSQELLQRTIKVLSQDCSSTSFVKIRNAQNLEVFFILTDLNVHVVH